MRFVVNFAPRAETMDVNDLGRLFEAYGFESLFFPEHSHLPVHSASVHPSGPVVHDRLRRFLDPFIALTAVASVTERSRVGTGVCLLPQHDPIVLAKQIATLVVLSAGRFLFGIGAGWNREELRIHGVDPADRWRVMRDCVLAMQRIWTEDEAEYHGQFVDFDPVWQWSKPLLRPHPTVIVGGEGPRVLERALDYDDERRPNDEPDTAARVLELNRLATERGRPPVPLPVFLVPADRDVVERHAAAGVTRCVYSLPSGDADAVLPVVERLAAMVVAYGKASVVA